MPTVGEWDQLSVSGDAGLYCVLGSVKVLETTEQLENIENHTYIREFSPFIMQ